MSYVIGGATITGKNWRQRSSPGVAQDRREETFPGVPERLVVKGAVMPGDLLVTGDLTGTGASVALAIQNLQSSIDTENARRGNATAYAVTVTGNPFTSMELIDFKVLSNIVPRRTPGSATIYVSVLAAWSWRKLA